MPELPEIEVVRRHLKSRIVGATIKNIWIGRKDIVRQGLASLSWYRDASITEILRFGKSLAMECQRSGETRFLVAELGMTGLLLCDPRFLPSEKHRHMVMHLANGNQSEVHYWNARRFGRLSLLTHRELQDYRQRRFGIDPLNVSEDVFVALIKGCRGRIKSLLLHQQKIAGIGNIYANEMLFRAGIHPYSRGSRLSAKRIRKLYHCMLDLLGEAIEKGGSSIRDFQAPDGRTGTFQHWHQVYQRAGQNCANRCGTVIRVLRAERSSFFCSRCQKR